jgi:glucosyl-3-phosphoglycerate synthase
MRTAHPAIIRNFNGREFTPEDLLKARERSGQTISLIIPARNEASTIGPIVSSVYKSLVRDIHLVSEIIVIDGLSDDSTMLAAADAGATVYSIAEAGPPTGCSGKGAALWKSQFVSHGDIMVFVDADILNFGARFVTGLAGPLLEHEDIYFVKAFYRRPLRIETAEYENFGGRITEILVKPVLSAFVPELSAVLQPLGGEYAFRRDILGSLPFASGYGVEIGLLFDFYHRHGLEHMAQVDLERRVHRNRPVAELGPVARNILQVMMKKLEQRDLLSIHRPLVSSRYLPDIDVKEISTAEDIELPPRHGHAVSVSAS